MIVYVVVGSYDYEGFGSPDGVFTEYSNALALAEKVASRYDGINIFRYHIGVPVEEPCDVYSNRKTVMEYVEGWNTPATTTVGT